MKENGLNKNLRTFKDGTRKKNKKLINKENNFAKNERKITKLERK